MKNKDVFTNQILLVPEFIFKAAVISKFTLTVDQMTMCDVNKLACGGETL